MPTLTRKSSVVFPAPFSLPGLEETLPAGTYDLETEVNAPSGHINPENWKASVIVTLQPRETHPGMVRTLRVALTAIEAALARDLSTYGKPSDHFLERMLESPLVRLLMQSDGVSESEVRRIYSGARANRGD